MHLFQIKTPHDDPTPHRIDVTSRFFGSFGTLGAGQQMLLERSKLVLDHAQVVSFEVVVASEIPANIRGVIHYRLAGLESERRFQMKTIMCCLALVALAVFTSAAFAQEPTLTSVEAKFDTTTDNKDQQTKLDVYVKTSDGHEVAKSEGNEGRWNKNSTHTVTLQVEGSPTKGEVANGSVKLTLHPQRRNKWRFNYKVTLKFSDDTFITKEFDGCFLTEHDPARTDSLR